MAKDPTDAEKAALDAMAAVPQSDPPADEDAPAAVPADPAPDDPAVPDDLGRQDPGDLKGPPVDPSPEDVPNAAPPAGKNSDPNVVPEDQGNDVSAQDATSGESPSAPPVDPDPNFVEHEEPTPALDPEAARANAVDEANAIIAAAVENKADAPPAETPVPEDKEELVYVVYMAIDGANYPGKHLTVILEDADNFTLTLEERVPTQVPASVAKAAAQLESDHYTIESA